MPSVCETGRFEKNKLTIACWKGRTIPGKRRISEKLKLAILCRGRIRLQTERVRWLLERGTGWINRLTAALSQKLPWVDVTIELFINQRVGRLTNDQINAIFKEYLQLRKTTDFKDCPYVVYNASPAVSKTTYEKRLGIKLDRLFQLAGVPPERMDVLNQQRFWLLVYASFPREAEKFLAPEKKIDSASSSPSIMAKSVSQWRELAEKTFINWRQMVPGQMLDIEAKELNRKVTASYAKMYLNRPSLFKWAGMAAFASAEVRRGMQQAWQLGFGDWGMSSGGTLAVWIGGLVKTGESIGPMLGKKLFWALSGGNRFVWWDIFWQHLAYHEEGIAAFVATHRTGELPLRVLNMRIKS